MRKLIGVSVLALIATLTFAMPALADDGLGSPACWPSDCAGTGPAGPGSGGGTGGSEPPTLWGNVPGDIDVGPAVNSSGIGDLINEEVTDIICGDCAPELDTSAFWP